MNQFAGVRDAKEFLIAKIAEQAHLEGVPLSEIERKVLYFSETEWTPPDIAKVSEAFHREYDDKEYEERIARLIRAARKRAGTTHGSQVLTEAVVGRRGWLFSGCRSKTRR